MKRVDELFGVELDCYVAKALDSAEKVYHYGNEGWGIRWHRKPKAYSSEWAYGGPVIDAQDIYIEPSNFHKEGPVFAYVDDGHEYSQGQYGNSRLEAAMRAFVASKLGDVVQPDKPAVAASPHALDDDKKGGA